MNGRIDLVQAESVLSLIECRSKLAARTALRQVQGTQSRELSEIIESLTWSMAQLEANIDFSSEDIEVTAEQKIIERVEGVREKLEETLKSFRLGRILYSGFTRGDSGRTECGQVEPF